MTTGIGRVSGDWAQRKDNNVERLTDEQLEAAIRWVRVIAPRKLSDIQVERLGCALDELATLRSQHAEVLGTVREAVELMQGEASLWHDLYPAWLVYALLGEGATAAKPFSKVNRLNMSRQCDAIRALVALAEVQK